MINTNYEHNYQGPCGALTTVNRKITTNISKAQEKGSIEAKKRYYDTENNTKRKRGYASITRINATKRVESSNKEIKKIIKNETD